MTEDKQVPAFNGAVNTLDRINQLLIDMQKYRVNNNPLGHRANLFELYKEVYPMLTQKEQEKAKKQRRIIKEYAVTQDEDTGELFFDEELFDELDELDLYLRSALVKKKISFAFFTSVDKMAALYRKYGINEDA